MHPTLSPLRVSLLCAVLLCALAARAAFAQALTEPGGKAYSTKTVWDYPHTGEPPMPPVKPLLDVGLRDTAITRGPDDTYYLTGTIGPDFMTDNAGIRV